MKVVVDTNVFVSGVFFGGKPRRFLKPSLMATLPDCAALRFSMNIEKSSSG